MPKDNTGTEILGNDKGSILDIGFVDLVTRCSSQAFPDQDPEQ